MTANVNILRGDLHLAVSTAFNRGRYVLMTGGADGAPIEITLDLRERPDDLFGGEWQEYAASPGDAPSDDHGPTIPAQTPGMASAYAAPLGPRVYEFALQDFDVHRRGLLGDVFEPLTLDQIDIVNAEGFNEEAVAAADWVHVYDRVTRERRTLKRPAADAVLTGLRDVAADLRGKTYPEKAADHMQALERGAPVEPPFGCAALPPVGPLTSTDGLLPGDVLRFIAANDGYLDKYAEGECVIARDVAGGVVSFVNARNGADDHWSAPTFAFVGRPDADGWMTWAGGENPVPGALVEVRFPTGNTSQGEADVWNWGRDNARPNGEIVAFRIVDTPTAV